MSMAVADFTVSILLLMRLRNNTLLKCTRLLQAKGRDKHEVPHLYYQNKDSKMMIVLLKLRSYLPQNPQNVPLAVKKKGARLRDLLLHPLNISARH